MSCPNDTPLESGKKVQALVPKLTLITVSFNSEKTIRDTLQSVVNQSYEHLEYIVIDGGSTDNTCLIVSEYTGVVSKLICEPDNGIYDAMNKGLRCASGDVVGFLNSDDVFADSQTLLKIGQVFESPSIQACYGDLVYVTQDNSRILRYWKSNVFTKGSFAKGWCPPHPTFYVRRSLVSRLGLFDLTYKLAADADFMMRYLERSNVEVTYIPEVLVRMRIGGATSKSLGNIRQQNSEIFRALQNNEIKYSKLSFCGYKLCRRFWQLIFGWFRNA